MFSWILSWAYFAVNIICVKIELNLCSLKTFFYAVCGISLNQGDIINHLLLKLYLFSIYPLGFDWVFRTQWTVHHIQQGFGFHVLLVYFSETAFYHNQCHHNYKRKVNPISNTILLWCCRGSERNVRSISCWIFKLFATYETEVIQVMEESLVLRAYDYILKCSNTVKLWDKRSYKFYWKNWTLHV